MEKRCDACGRPLAHNANRCLYCGFSYETRCPECGQIVFLETLVCPNCHGRTGGREEFRRRLSEKRLQLAKGEPDVPARAVRRRRLTKGSVAFLVIIIAIGTFACIQIKKQSRLLARRLETLDQLEKLKNERKFEEASSLANHVLKEYKTSGPLYGKTVRDFAREINDSLSEIDVARKGYEQRREAAAKEIENFFRVGSLGIRVTDVYKGFDHGKPYLEIWALVINVDEQDAVFRPADLALNTKDGKTLSPTILDRCFSLREKSLSPFQKTSGCLFFQSEGLMPADVKSLNIGQNEIFIPAEAVRSI